MPERPAQMENAWDEGRLLAASLLPPAPSFRVVDASSPLYVRSSPALWKQLRPGNFLEGSFWEFAAEASRKARRGEKPKSILDRLSSHYNALPLGVPETFRITGERTAEESAANSGEPQNNADMQAPLPVVHRLDEGTSGVLLMAKTVAAGSALRQQFKERKIKKTYFAIVHIGEALRGPMTVASGVGRDSRNRRKMQNFRQLPGVFTACLPGGTGKVRGAVTFLKPLLSNGKFGVVLAYPITGRTHQIRLHLQMLKNPIVGDQLYGDPAATSRFFACMPIRRGTPGGAPAGLAGHQDKGAPPGGPPRLQPLLHAANICCAHPATGGRLAISAPFWEDMREALDAVAPQWGSVPELIPFSGRTLP
ncbi:hypothetical protein Efla_002606 [Eimeria flavescens]